jgi:uncharacterized repeat protein (TIGR03803 family)
VEPVRTLDAIHLSSAVDSSGVGIMSALAQAPGGDFYGTSSRGGAFNLGTVFKWNPSGTFAVLHDFAGEADGALPHSIILGTDGNFYGTTEAGGSAGLGNVFQMTPARHDPVRWRR